MGDKNKRHEIIEALISLSNEQGFLTADDIVKTAVTIDLHLDDIDRICGILINKGTIIHDDDDVSDKIANEDLEGYLTSRAKIDYEEVFNRVIQIDESLIFYINELKQITPPRKGEEKQLIYQAKQGERLRP